MEMPQVQDNTGRHAVEAVYGYQARSAVAGTKNASGIRPEIKRKEQNLIPGIESVSF
jgi:hypothetical protein